MKNEDLEVVQFLVSHGADVNALCLSSQKVSLVHLSGFISVFFSHFSLTLLRYTSMDNECPCFYILENCLAVKELKFESTKQRTEPCFDLMCTILSVFFYLGHQKQNLTCGLQKRNRTTNRSARGGGAGKHGNCQSSLDLKECQIGFSKTRFRLGKQ